MLLVALLSACTPTLVDDPPEVVPEDTDPVEDTAALEDTGGPPEDTGAEPDTDLPDDTAPPDDTATDTGDTVPTDTGDPTPPDPAWEQFLAERDAYLTHLGMPILDCVARVDTSHAAFHGCIDWHSAVHGTWALLALADLTGDPTYAAAADATLDPASVQAELTAMQGWLLQGSEIPYGYSWFLKLATERELAGYTDLQPHADVALIELAQHLRAMTPATIDVRIEDPAYGNLSWEVYNMWARASATGDTAAEALLEGFVRDEMVPRSSLCPLVSEVHRTSEFFPPCLHLARLITEVLPPAEADAWVATWVPTGAVLSPLTQPVGAHPAGLNFSRAWGLWALYQATGDTSWRTQYVDHIVTHMYMPEFWRDDYYAHSHWVPQFGVYAVALSYE